MKKTIKLTESDLMRLVERIISEGVDSNKFKVGQKFDEVHNRQYIMAKGYQTAGSGGGAHNYNDFSFRNPKVVKVSNDTITLKLDYGFYNPNDEWKTGQNDIKVDGCLVIPYDKIQEIRENQIMISIPNSSLKSYLASC